MNPRLVATQFLNLPWHVKMRISKELGVDTDPSEPEVESWRILFKTAREQDKLPQLEKLVEDATCER